LKFYGSDSFHPAANIHLSKVKFDDFVAMEKECADSEFGIFGLADADGNEPKRYR